MVGFSNLSNELVLMIWDFVELEDIYSFSTVSKQVYLLTHDLLREHWRLNHRLCTISNVGAKPGEPRVFSQILKEILLNPRAARYPSSLGFDAWASDPEHWEKKGGSSQGMVPVSDLELFKQAAKDTAHASEESLKEDWLEKIERGNEEPLIALLLLLLPNLREVELGGFSDWSFSITDTLSDIALEEDKSPGSLRKLRSVRLKRSSSHDNFLDFECIRLFAALPSVTSIYGYFLGSGPNDLLQTLPLHTGSTNVTDLSFHRCLICPKTMSVFLSTTWNLQRFFYSPGESANNPANFDPFWIRAALLANAQGTLKSLTILAGRHPRHFMGSLAGFTCLESLETDLGLLIGDPSISFHSPSSMLPASIVNIKLHIEYSLDGAYYEASIQDVVDHPTLLDHLDKITVVGVPNVQAAELSHESLFRVLERRGTRLFFIAESEPDGASDA